MGKNSLNLPISEFLAKVDVTLRVSRGQRSNLNGVETVSYTHLTLPTRG